MGFLGKLFGGKKGDEKPTPRGGPGGRRATGGRADAGGAGRASAPGPVEGGPPEMGAKQWIRLLGQSNAERREAAATALKELGDRSAVRPLINAYLNYGDAAVLDALTSFGRAVTAAAISEAHDASNVSERRARLMDVLGATGDESVANLVRDEVASSDLAVRVRACVALVRLGDLAGIDSLESDLQQAAMKDRRKAALRGLSELKDVPQAARAIEAHVNRFLGQGGAIPEKIEVSAPRLEQPDISMVGHIIGEILRTDHDLVVVIGPGATDIARSRQGDMRRGLPDHTVYFLTPQMMPDEQMTALEEARDLAATIPEHTVLVLGQLPAPNDNPPLRHFLTPGRDNTYSCKIIIVDPHGYGSLRDWWHYIEDKSQVECEFEVVLSASSPERSATSQEEYLIYQLAPEAKKPQFARALLAHL